MQPERTVVAICITSNGHWVEQFWLSLVKAVAYFNAARKGNEFLALLAEGGSILPRQRQSMLETAIANGATHALFLDTDMNFPHDTVHRLLRHNVDIVGCNYARRGKLPIQSTAGNIPEPGGSFIFRLRKDGGLEEVDYVATGVLMIRLAILKDIPKPWFNFVYDEAIPQPESHGHWLPEDWYFCQKAREAGYKVYVDHGLSWEIGHIGQFEYRLNQALVEVPEVLRMGPAD